VNVRDLMSRLGDADEDAVVLYLQEGADPSEANEICHVELVSALWTCECQIRSDASTKYIHHPASHGFSIGWNSTSDSYHPEYVFILGPLCSSKP